MHPISFAFKRAHLSCVAFGSKVVERIEGMTPAAFDVMFAIRTNFGADMDPKGSSWWREGVEQQGLWRELGLHPSTISKLLKRLRLLGWVRNDAPSDYDRRTKKVLLTEMGRRRIERAMRIVFQQHTHWREFENIFKREGPRHVLPVLVDYTRNVHRIAGHFGDTAKNWLYYFDYDPKKPVPRYIEKDWWRADRRNIDAYDWTSYRDAHNCASAHACDWAIESTKPRPIKWTSSVSRRRRCLTTLARVADRPESRLTILMLQHCRYDQGADERKRRRIELERHRKYVAEKRARRMAEDPWFAGFEEAREAEERFRAGDPLWNIPRDVLEMLEQTKRTL